MKFETVILYFNKPTMTARCLASVRAAQLHAGARDHHTVLVDNGSVESLAADDCRTEKLSLNRGFAAGMNTGLRVGFANADTRLVTLLSNDIELPPEFFQDFNELAATNDPVIWCPHTYFLSDWAKPSYTHGTFLPESAELSHHFDPLKESISFPDYYPAAATVWTRVAFERLGGFDERYFCYWEDVELSHRCQTFGVRLVSAKSLRIHHLGRGTTGGKVSYSAHFNRGRELTLEILSNRGLSSNCRPRTGTAHFT